MPTNTPLCALENVDQEFPQRLPRPGLLRQQGSAEGGRKTRAALLW